MTAQKKTTTPDTSAEQSTGPRLSDLTPEWRALVVALASGSAQLLVRLAALEQSGQIGPVAAVAYAGWTERVSAVLAALPKE